MNEDFWTRTFCPSFTNVDFFVQSSRLIPLSWSCGNPFLILWKSWWADLERVSRKDYRQPSFLSKCPTNRMPSESLQELEICVIYSNDVKYITPPLPLLFNCWKNHWPYSWTWKISQWMHPAQELCTAVNGRFEVSSWVKRWHIFTMVTLPCNGGILANNVHK